MDSKKPMRRFYIAATMLAAMQVAGIPTVRGGDAAGKNQQACPQNAGPASALRVGPPGVSIQPSRRMRPKGFTWDDEIRIALPGSYCETSKSYPVLWVTDGSYMFDIAVEMVNGWEAGNGVPEMIVVGIGVPPDADKEYKARRVYEFTSVPPYGESDTPGRKFWKAYEAYYKTGEAAVAYGGASKFLSFMVDQVRPALRRDYRMSDDNTLMGHSAGGAFCAYAIFARPGEFDKYLCGLSGTWSDLPALEEQYAKTHNDLPIRAFFGVAGSDLSSSKDKFLLGEVLKKRNYPSLRLYTQNFPDDDHQSVVPNLLSRGLRALWGGGVAATPYKWPFEVK